MTWRSYCWGDRELLDGQSVRTDCIPTTTTLVDDQGDILAVAGLVPWAPGTFEVFLVLGAECVSSWPMYKALRNRFDEVAGSDGICRIFAMIDPSKKGADDLAESVGLDFEAFLPAWWNGQDRLLMGRVQHGR